MICAAFLFSGYKGKPPQINLNGNKIGHTKIF